jgi:hypothetical protein
MRRLLGLLAAFALPAAVHAADSFDYKLTFPDGTPGVMHASVAKAKPGEKHAVTCEYAVSQEEEMGLADMPLGSWQGTEALQKVDRSTVRSLGLRHYDDALPPD